MIERCPAKSRRSREGMSVKVTDFWLTYRWRRGNDQVKCNSRRSVKSRTNSSFSKHFIVWQITMNNNFISNMLFIVGIWHCICRSAYRVMYHTSVVARRWHDGVPILTCPRHPQLLFFLLHLLQPSPHSRWTWPSHYHYLWLVLSLARWLPPPLCLSPHLYQRFHLITQALAVIT